MSIKDRIFSRDDKDENLAEKAVKLLNNRNENLVVVEPLTSGLFTLKISNSNVGSSILESSYIPRSKQSYGQFISMDSVGSFPNKEFSNSHDAQLIADNVREISGANHSIAIIGPLDGSSEQEVYVGFNMEGKNTGVFVESFELGDDLDSFKQDVTIFALKNFLKEYKRYKSV